MPYTLTVPITFLVQGLGMIRPEPWRQAAEAHRTALAGAGRATSALSRRDDASTLSRGLVVIRGIHFGRRHRPDHSPSEVEDAGLGISTD